MATHAPLLPFDAPSRAAAEAHAERCPEVYAAIVRASRVLLSEARARGSERISMKAVFEAIRWRGEFRRADGEAWLLNNNLHAGYARLVMDREPDLRGVFEVRERKA